jgi:hypothetical protein
MVAQIEQNFGNATHADPTDAYKMNMLDLPFSIHGPSNNQIPNSKSQIISNHQIPITETFGYRILKIGIYLDIDAWNLEFHLDLWF